MVVSRTASNITSRFVFAVALSAALGLGPSFGIDATEPCWRPPVGGAVVDPFREPPCRWCAGNRGIDYAVGSRAVVRAAASGSVTFAGSVAGVRYVVIRLPNGWRQTYGSLSATALAMGDPVLAGSVIGSASGAFFFGVRVGERYVDPAPHLGTPVGRARLIPSDGSAARPAPPPTWRCQVGRAPR